MASFTHIDNEDMWKRKMKFVDGGKYEGPGWYSMMTGCRDEPSTKPLDKAPVKSAAIISGRPLKPPGEFNSLLKKMKKELKGDGINTY